jgi:hypothetical protein
LAIAVAAQVSSPQKEVFMGNHSASPLYGFDFVEDVTTSPYIGNGATKCGAGAYTSYFLKASDSNFAYMATDLDDLQNWPAKQSYKAAFRIKACQGDGYESGFAVVFSLEDVVPGAATKGNGDDTGAFTNSVKVKFHENGNSWDIALTQVVGGTETKLGGASTPNSDEHRLFHFQVDNRDTSMPRIVLQDFGGTTILQADTDGAFKGRVVHGLWFVGYGFGFAGRDTVLVAESPSTKIYDTDPRPPEVQGVSYLPNPVGAGQAVEVTATVADDWGVDHVHLIYRINGGSSQAAVMAAQGGNGWRGTIPGQSGGTPVTFRIEATDTTGLVGHSPKEYSYVVSSGQPIDDDESNPYEPPEPGGGKTSTAKVGHGIAAIFILVGGLLVASIVRGESRVKGDGYEKIGKLLVLVTILAAPLYFALATNLAGTLDSVRELPKALWITGTGVLALAGALPVLRRLRRRPAA